MRVFTRIVTLSLALIFALHACALAEAAAYTNPLINPKGIEEYTALPKNTLNILLLGIDFGRKGYWGSGSKKSLEDCHTDAVMVVAVNLDDKTVNLVSLPRDTVTYVPGVKGIYKLNAAFNCGDSVEDGLQKISDAASWVLGGIRIDYYCAVDLNTMAVLGDTMGGIDFELAMSYTGHSGKKYSKGLHHLDGVGITDYLRSRTNATVNGNDIGRTGRQRELMLAIFQKLKGDPALLMKVTKAAQEMEEGFFTNVVDAPTTVLLPLLSIAMGLNMESIGSYVITGKYRGALQGWNFTFTDQENRQAVIKEVFGVDVPPLKYVEFAYTQWLVDSGFKSVHTLAVADQLRAYVVDYNHSDLTAEQKATVDAFEAAYHEAARAFETAADSMSKEDTKIMGRARVKLLECGDAAAKILHYEKKLPWTAGKYFYKDPYVNEVELDWR